MEAVVEQLRIEAQKYFLSAASSYDDLAARYRELDSQADTVRCEELARKCREQAEQEDSKGEIYQIVTLDGVVVAEGSLEDAMAGADLLAKQTGHSFAVKKTVGELKADQAEKTKP